MLRASGASSNHRRISRLLDRLRSRAMTMVKAHRFFATVPNPRGHGAFRAFAHPYGFNASPHLSAIVRASSCDNADVVGNLSFQANGLTASMRSLECEVTPRSFASAGMRGSSAELQALRTMST